MCGYVCEYVSNFSLKGGRASKPINTNIIPNEPLIISLSLGRGLGGGSDGKCDFFRMMTSLISGIMQCSFITSLKKERHLYLPDNWLDSILKGICLSYCGWNFTLNT